MREIDYGTVTLFLVPVPSKNMPKKTDPREYMVKTSKEYFLVGFLKQI